MPESDRDRQFKNAIYDQIARVGRAVSHPRRLELLDLLCQGPASVEQLAQKAGLSMGSTSQHLQLLKEARLVRSERRGTFVIYQLQDDLTCGLFHTLVTVAEQHYAEMRAITEAFLNEHGALEAVDLPTLQSRLQEGELVLVDVRPAEEYRAGHWPGALSVPLETLAQHLAELPRGRTVVAYCRGPYCVLALHAVELLQEAGFRALRLRGGVSEWRAQGLPMAKG
jgi:rhodanese-related sulfurtransferase/DNA-binding transcriptional regulator YhcF (GntR family)